MDVSEADKFGVADGARKLAVDTILKALIDHASFSDPSFKYRVIGNIDAYLAALPNSELEQDFAKRTRAYIDALVRPQG
ncbi:MAG: hypothetical protein KIT48_00695 [Pseudolabrys sp.]|jgi:hypothetical protein|nr:hypothetical protein [Pseudolabrys sp.]